MVKQGQTNKHFSMDSNTWTHQQIHTYMSQLLAGTGCSLEGLIGVNREKESRESVPLSQIYSNGG